ncbi:DJ-1/PfpI family protein [Antarcticimicrobium luteum]|uniref:DJ-1/PfpI family protein n=1 Tax=Antarcticimicrobium luteum TaxID=2547397 RepID=A0A4R5V9C2_9RHOB|nr:DJ-1/PfpI family protein [Antarcticimicrobium luteum]TDK48680.1 DJ-1/PfpI family protein [Antarcticimicrobium luteum]
MRTRIGFLAFSGVEELDLVGPWEMATMWRDYAAGPECLVVAQQKGPVRCAKGLEITAEEDFESCPALDALVVPGGFAAFDEAQNQTLLDFVRAAAAGGRNVLSVCSGSFILLAAGLLGGRRATTHWKVLGQLRQAGVEVVEERFVRDGNIWSSGGVSAGIDLMLHFIAETAGAEAAASVQHNAEYYPARQVYGRAHQAPDMPAYMKRL